MREWISYLILLCLALIYNLLLGIAYKKGWINWSDNFQLLMAYVGVVGISVIKVVIS